MAELTQLSAEFFAPYLTLLNYFKYTGINVFDEKNEITYKLRKSHYIALFLYIYNTINHGRYVLQEIKTNTDFIELAVDLSYCVNSLEGCLIYIHFCCIKNKIKNYIIRLGKHWLDDDSLTRYAIDMKRSQVKQINRYTLVYCTIARIFIHSYMATPLILILIKKFILNVEVKLTTPLRFILPFDYQSNMIIFVSFYLLDYTIVCILAHFINCSLYFISVTLSHLRTLFMLLQEDFKKVIKTGDGAELKLIIKRHSKLSKLLDDLGDAFGAIFALNVLFLSFTICLYVIAAKVNGRLEDLKNVFISTFTILNIYYCCRYGQLVTDSALDIGKVIYDSAWEDLPIQYKKIILFTMLRSQPASYIKSMKCIKISFNTFVTMLNTSWSVISLIINLYQE